jgi:hypothetical protein
MKARVQRGFTKSVARTLLSLLGVLLACAAGIAHAQIRTAVQVPLEMANGWGPVKPPAGYKALRIQGRSTADLFVLARLFADFAAHPAMFPRVVEGVDILACNDSSLKARYRTVFDSRPGGKSMVESVTTVKVSIAEDRVAFIWSSDSVKSGFINAARGQLMVSTRRTADGTETLIDYVTAVRPKNGAKGLLVETQKPVLASDAKYVVDQLTVAAKQRTAHATAAPANTNLFNCSPVRP